MMTGNEIREKFLAYFERHGHTRVRSSPLLPANDPTLLFTNAGMNQFKDTFLGLEKRDYVRACSSQKCVRAGGKHNDLDEVGKTARHQTFFEMLGNFSFGDYFKEDAIKFAWDLLVNEFKLDPARMWFSVFEGDDQVGPDEDAERFWHQVGAPKERILRFGRKDNFWQMGETGPCGPCSEVHYYMGDAPNDAENCAANVNGPTDIITELWNLVFMQFNRIGEGAMDPATSTYESYRLESLPKPSVDTGMGLERLTVVLQGVKTNYETDLLKDIVEFVAKLSGRKYEAETQEGFAMRVIADHARATAFLIADGILPANEGRNYVLRKIMRRAIYQGRHTLGFEGLFFYQVTDFVCDQMGKAYPELEASRDFIGNMVRMEEQRFGQTLSEGQKHFDEQAPLVIGNELDRARNESQNDSDEGIVLGDFDGTPYEAGRKYLSTQDRVTSVEVEMSDGTVVKKSLEELSSYERQEVEKIEMMLRFSRPAREAYERMAPFIREHEKIRGLTENYERMRPHIEQMERSRAQIEEHRRILSELERHPVQSNIETYRRNQEQLRPLIMQFERIRPQVERALSRLEQINSVTSQVRAVELARALTPLYDTHGFPPDLIRVGLESYGLSIDEAEFNEAFSSALNELHQKSRDVKTQDRPVAGPVYQELSKRLPLPQFKGYETTRVDDAKILAIIRDDNELSLLSEGGEGEVILDRTPFYAESGGQVGDTGTLAGKSHVTVTDTYSPVSGLFVHKISVDNGVLKVGDVVVAQVDVEKRDATRRNHTATHLVHAALREVLGGHVKQAGSVVAPNYLRFDFNHYQPMTEDEVKEVERLVNEQILRNVTVDTEVMPVEDAIRGGAMALFGEKYAGMMRVLTVPGFSKELCGGTHVRATGDIGVFKITSDESIASGVRRIRAVTGIDAYERFREDEEIIERVAGDLRTSRAELPAVIGKLQDDLKKARREAEELKLKIASGAISTSTSNGDEARDVAGVRVLAKEASGLDAAQMRQLSDTLLDRIKSGVVVLGRSNDGKASLIVRTSDDLTKKVPAGQVIKELAPIIGGKGGGKADMAEGGGNRPEKLSEALQASYGVIERLLNP